MSSAAMYLALTAQRLALRLMEDPDAQHGYSIKVWGLNRLEPLTRECARHQIRTHKPALIALLKSGSPAALAVRQEGRESEGQQRKEAA